MFHSFIGCLQDLRINKDDVPLETAIPSSLGHDPPPASPGCPREDVCFPSPCQNGGSCETGWTNATCRCPEGYWGPYCSKVSAVTFNGATSYLELVVNTSSVPFGDTMSLEVRTRASSGQLLHLQLLDRSRRFTDSLQLKITNNRLEMSTRAHSSTATSVTLAESVSDGDWHQLYWRILATKILFKVDGIATSLDLKFDVFSSDRNSDVVVYVGARPYLPGKQQLQLSKKFTKLHTWHCSIDHSGQMY
ncbi:hypothetical protein NP493_758g01000 [Ridgeia piscesae]|uniref:Uncharacterized protein n=1 Tax=Ridgeia piscesae TaxID=27915 RepID=A0AAD9NNL1_RIDPI|nr:hypothetical protein NP493_758g01000 [Ridgeia piscesae]